MVGEHILRRAGNGEHAQDEDEHGHDNERIGAAQGQHDKSTSWPDQTSLARTSRHDHAVVPAKHQ